MILSLKIRLKLTKEQEILCKKSAGVARFVYNLMISENKKIYEEYLLNGKQGTYPFVSRYDFSKRVTVLKKLPDYSWLSEVSSKVAVHSCIDCDTVILRLNVFLKDYLIIRSLRRKALKIHFM